MLSVLPMNTLELVVPLEELPEEELPEDPLDDEPPLTLEPPGRVRVEPLEENTIFPFWSVRYVEIPADESLLNAADVGCPYELSLPTQITPYFAPVALRKEAELEPALP